MNTEAKITAVYDTEDWEENGMKANPQAEHLIEDRLTLLGEKLHFDMSDDEQGVYFIGKQGYTRALNVFINKDDEVCVEIPNELKSGSYLIQICRKSKEDSCIDTVTFERPIEIKGFLEVYGATPEDYFYNEGYEDGIDCGRKDLIKELEERGVKVPEELKPKKIIVVKKKEMSPEGVSQVQVKQIATI